LISESFIPGISIVLLIDKLLQYSRYSEIYNDIKHKKKNNKNESEH